MAAILFRERWVKDTSGLHLDMSDADVLLFMVGAGDTKLLIPIVTITQHIITCRCNNSIPTMVSIKIRIKDIYKIEKYIAMQNYISEQHNVKRKLR